MAASLSMDLRERIICVNQLFLLMKQAMSPAVMSR